MCDGGREIGLDPRERRLLDVFAVRKVVVAFPDTRGSAEVVDPHRGGAALGEAQRKLLVEAVQATDVGQDHDAVAGRLFRNGGERREARPVSRLEDEIPVRDGGAGYDGDRRLGIELEAHC